MAVAAMSVWSAQFWGCVAFHVACSIGAVWLMAQALRAPAAEGEAEAEEGAA